MSSKVCQSLLVFPRYWQGNGLNSTCLSFCGFLETFKKPVQYESCKSLWDNKLFFKEILVNNCILNVSCVPYILYLWSLIWAWVNYFKNMQCSPLLSIKGINNLQCALDLRCYTVWLSIYFILVAMLIHISDVVHCDFFHFFQNKIRVKLLPVIHTCLISKRKRHYQSGTS